MEALVGVLGGLCIVQGIWLACAIYYLNQYKDNNDRSLELIDRIRESRDAWKKNYYQSLAAIDRIRKAVEGA